MKIAMPQESFKSALAMVARATSKRTTLPVLSGVLLSANGEGDLHLAATDLEIALRLRSAAQVDEPGQWCAPAGFVGKWVGAMPPARIDLTTVTGKPGSAHLSCARHECTVHGHDAQDFPALPVHDPSAPCLELTPATLARLVACTAYAASTDTSRLALTGVLIKTGAEGITLAATDGWRLALARASLAGLPEATAIVPARALAELARLAALAHPDLTVTLALTPRYLQADLPGADGGAFLAAELTSQLIDARYPAYDRIVPTSWATRAVVDTAALVKALRTDQPFAAGPEHSVLLQVAPGTDTAPGSVTVRAQDPQTGNATSVIDATVEGPGLEFAINAGYLLAALGPLGTPQAALELRKAGQAIAVRPVGVDDYTAVIMPMQKGR